MEVETLEGDALQRLLNSDPNEPWPPTDAPKQDFPPPTPQRVDDGARRPAYEPRPGGLAWEGGSQTRADGGNRKGGSVRCRALPAGDRLSS